MNYTTSTADKSIKLNMENKCNYIPIHRSCIFQISDKEISKSAIILTEKQEEEKITQEVNALEEVIIVSKGKDCQWIEVGDLVKLGNIRPILIQIKGSNKRYIQIAESDILGIITK